MRLRLPATCVRLPSQREPRSKRPRGPSRTALREQGGPPLLFGVEFLYLLAEAKILEPVLVDAEAAARMVRPYSWFLDRSGAEGIKLTAHGCLLPPHAEVAVADLGLAE